MISNQLGKLIPTRSTNHPKAVEQQDLETLDLGHTKLWDYYHSVSQADRLPARSDIDPADIVSLLSRVVLIDVITLGGKSLFKFRLVGTQAIREWGQDPTDKYLDELPFKSDTLSRRMEDGLKLAIGTRRVVHDRFPMPFATTLYPSMETIHFPLASDGETVDMLLSLYSVPDHDEHAEHLIN